MDLPSLSGELSPISVSSSVLILVLLLILVLILVLLLVLVVLLLVAGKHLRRYHVPRSVHEHDEDRPHECLY